MRANIGTDNGDNSNYKLYVPSSTTLASITASSSTSEDGCDTIGGTIDAYPLTEFTNAAISNGKVSGVPLVFETVVAQ